MADRGSRMHVLDWIERDDFASTLNDMVALTGLTVASDGNRLPRNSVDRTEARIGKACGGLIPEELNRHIRDWWLVKHRGANVPNWDLACAASESNGRPGLVLFEAKGHVAEFTGESKGKSVGNLDNHARIAVAIEEARSAIDRWVPGTAISANEWYQLANRVAFAWKLAASGVPTVLVYLAFTGDEGVGVPFHDNDHWSRTLMATSAVLPTSAWGRRIDCDAAPLWMLIRSRPCLRQTPVIRASRTSPTWSMLSSHDPGA